MTLGMMALAAFLTWFSFKVQNILISLSAGILWLGLAMWFFFAVPPLFNLATVYAQLIVWVFFMMTFVPFLALMNTEIKMEKDGMKWSEWGARPRDQVTGYERYKKELRGRIRR